MAKKRMKAAALAVPQSTEEAIELLARFAEIDAAIEQVKLEADAAKALIDANRDTLCAEPIAEQKALVARLKPFWLARQQEITGGKRKSVVLGGCEIGTRTGNPTLKFPKDAEEDLIEDLQALGFGEWALRTTLKLDKPALIKALHLSADAPQIDQDDAAALTDLGFSVAQTETFFVARAVSEPAEAETVGREAAE